MGQEALGSFSMVGLERGPARSGFGAWPWAGLGVATVCHSARVEAEEWLCCMGPTDQGL